MNYYTKEANENDFTHFYNLAQTKTVVHKWLINFLLSLFHLYHVNFILIKWTHFLNFSLHLCLTSSIVICLTTTPNNPMSCIRMLLETLSESDIQLLDKRVTDNLSDDKHQQDQGITVANASNNLCHSMCLKILVTTPLQRVLLLQLHKLI